MLLALGDKLLFVDVEGEWNIRSEHLNPECPDDVRAIRQARHRRTDRTQHPQPNRGVHDHNHCHPLPRGKASQARATPTAGRGKSGQQGICLPAFFWLRTRQHRTTGNGGTEVLSPPIESFRPQRPESSPRLGPRYRAREKSSNLTRVGAA